MNDTANANMVEFWNGDAGQKWVHLQEMMDASLMPLGQKAMAAAAIKAGERVIDIGCGCGDTSFALARQVGPEGAVSSVDISEPMLTRARARLAASGEKNISFALGDAQVHRFADTSFDLIFSRFGVMFFSDPVAAFNNLKSALKPGGRLTFVCWRPAKDNAWVRLPLEVVARHVPLPAPSDPEAPGEFAFGDGARVKRILSGAGFSDIAIDEFDTPLAVAGNGGPDEAAEFYLQMGPPARALGEADADAATKARVAADLRAALAPHDRGEGVVLDSAAWIVTARKS